MKKTKTEQSKQGEPALSEDDYNDMAWEIDDRREHEELLHHLQQHSKAELIQLVVEAQDRERAFVNWLMSNGGNLIAFDTVLDTFKTTYDELSQERHRRHQNQKKGRQTQAGNHAAKQDYSVALGVDDYYGLLREAIVIFRKNPQLKENHATEAKAIRTIIVNLLLEPNRSRHTRDQSAWEKIVNKNVKSGHFDTAKRQLERANSTSF